MISWHLWLSWLVRWIRWHSNPPPPLPHPVTGFEHRNLAGWRQPSYLTVTETLHDIELYEWKGNIFLIPWRLNAWTPADHDISRPRRLPSNIVKRACNPKALAWQPVSLATTQGTWRNLHQSVELCQCRCLPGGFETRLVQDFQIKISYAPLNPVPDVVQMLCNNVLYLLGLLGYLKITCFTWRRCKWVPGRTEIAMCTISSMRRNGCRTICSTWSWNETRIARSSDQGVKCKVSWGVFKLDIRL